MEGFDVDEGIGFTVDSVMAVDWNVTINGTQFRDVTTAVAFSAARAVAAGERLITLTVGDRVVVLAGALSLELQASIPESIPPSAYPDFADAVDQVLNMLAPAH